MILFYIFILYQINEVHSIKISDISSLKKYFNKIPLEIYSKTLKIERGLYGPDQGFALISREKIKIENSKEIPLPNIPGKLKLFVLNCKSQNTEFKIIILFKSYKNKWIIQSFKEVP